jgi:surface carbohydrate biosynthesis protein
MKKKTIYIPIEIKNRELHGHLYLATKLLSKDVKVVLGNKSLMYALLDQKNDKAGVLMYKGGGRDPKLFKKIKKKVDSITVLDQELGIAVRDLNDAFRRRFFKETISLVDRFYFFGKVFGEKAVEISKIPKEKIRVTGWPRVDLWKLDTLWYKDVNTLKEEYGKFILFSSDFGVNSKNEVAERAKRSVRWTEIKSNNYKEENRGIFQERYEEYLKFIEILHLIDKRSDIPHIVVRPHVSEDYSAWKRDLKGCENITIIHKGPIAPWILASDGVIHCGCTTAFESRLLGKKTAYFSKCSVSASDSLPIKISTPLYSVNDFSKWCKKSDQSTDVDWKFYLSQYALFENHNASTMLAEDLLSLCKNKELLNIKIKIPLFVRIGRYAPNFIKNRYSKIMFTIRNPGMKPLASYSQKMPGGLKKGEVVDFFKMLSYDTSNLSIKTLEKDLISIEIMGVGD